MASLRMAYFNAVSLTSVLALAGFAALTPLSAGTSPAVRDGLPTEAACRELGFVFYRPDRDGGGYHNRGGANLGGKFLLQAVPLPMAPTVSPSPVPGPSIAMEAAPAGNPVATPQPPFIPGFLPRDTERYPDVTSNPIKQVAEAPVSTFSIDVDTASYANVRRFLTDGHRPPRDAVRVEELINYFDYDYPKPDRAEVPFETFVAVAPSPWADGKSIVHIGLQGLDVASHRQPPLNLVFLVDVSGSMSGPDRLPLAKQALNLLVDQLRPEDHISMVVYSGAAGQVLEPTAGSDKLRIRCAIEALESGGSTAGGQGLALAYQAAAEFHDDAAVSRVILLTDGDFNVGIADPEKLEDFVAEKRATGTYLSVYGFGRGNYNDLMMQTLAQYGNGTAGYVDHLEEAQRLFRYDIARGLFPIADDVKIQVEFNPAYVAEYRLIGYETRLLNREDFNNDAVDAGEVGSGASVTALYEITPVGGRLSSDPLRYQPVSTNAGEDNGELAYLKIRYKLPGEGTSRLLQRPISIADHAESLDDAPTATRWAVAVAGYGQRLRGDPYLAAGFDWRQIADLASRAIDRDRFGLKQEFVRLVNTARTAVSVNE